jgi:uncharacterized membrane protein
MPPRLIAVKNWLIRRENKLIWGGIGVFVALITVLTAVKYAYYGYDALDLAIFNQIFWNTVHGRPFAMSIHPHLSLGDHAELAILPLSLPYALIPDPRTLLALQAAALGLAAWPLFQIAKLKFEKIPGTAARLAPLAVAFLWLANPLVWNVAFFEFHVLPFAVAPLLFAMLAYERGRKAPFLAWTMLALLCREDVALFVAAIGALAFFEKRERWWRVAPVAVAGVWFVAMMRLIGAYAVAGGYKFAVYYAWLGKTPAEMAANAFLHPIRLLQHLVTLPNAEMIIGFFMTLTFVPLLRPRRLLLAAAVLAQIVLGGTGGGELILQTHYVSLFLPAIFLAFIEALPHAPAAFRKMLPLDRREAVAGSAMLIALGTVFCAATIGPLPSAVALAFAPGDRARYAKFAEEAIAAVPADAPVAASYALLPRLSSRERLYSLHYVFLGVTQFAAAPYPPPTDLRYALLDLNDLTMYRWTFPTTSWTASQYAGGNARLLAALGTPTRYRGPFVTYEKDGSPLIVTESVTAEGAKAPLARYGALARDNDVIVTADWAMSGIEADGRVARFALKDASGKIRAEAAVLIDGIPPASRLVATDLRRTYAVLPTDGLPAGTYVPDITLEKTRFRLAMNGFRGTSLSPVGAPVVELTTALQPVVIGAPR